MFWKNIQNLYQIEKQERAILNATKLSKSEIDAALEDFKAGVLKIVH